MALELKHGNVADLTKRRLKNVPDFSLDIWITGVRVGDGLVLWDIEIEGEDDVELSAGILERAAEVLRDGTQ